MSFSGGRTNKGAGSGTGFDENGRVAEARQAGAKKLGGKGGRGGGRFFSRGGAEMSSPGGPQTMGQAGASLLGGGLGGALQLQDGEHPIRAMVRQRREADARSAEQERGMRESGTIDPEWASQNPEKAQAMLIDQQREDFNQRYRPLEEAAIAEFMKSPEQAAQRAGGVAGKAFSGASGMSERAMGRRGASMTADQRRASADATGLARARSIGTAENTTRRNVRDRNIEGLGTMVSIGKGISGGVNRDMGSAADMQSQRIQANKAASAARKQNMVSTAVSVGGLAIAF